MKVVLNRGGVTGSELALERVGPGRPYEGKLAPALTRMYRTNPQARTRATHGWKRHHQWSWRLHSKNSALTNPGAKAATAAAKATLLRGSSMNRASARTGYASSRLGASAPDPCCRRLG